MHVGIDGISGTYLDLLYLMIEISFIKQVN